MDPTVDTLTKLIGILEGRRAQRIAMIQDYDLSNLEGKAYAREDAVVATAFETAIQDARVFLNLAISEAKAREAVAA